MSGFVGIDVAAKTVDLVVRDDDKTSKSEQFSQTPDGHAAVVRKLQKLAPELIVMEATGIYYLDLAVALAKANLPVAVINPKSFHHFAALKLNGNKTDAVDAALLAEFAQCMRPRLWTLPQDELLGLRDIGRQLNRLTGSRTQAKNRLHALMSKGMTLPMLIEDEQEGIEQLERRIKRLTQAALTLIVSNEILAAHFDRLTAAKGIGETSAIAILAELCVLPSTMKAPQVSRYAGLDVRKTESGSSVNKPGRLSKAGNAYLRAALYMPAMSAVRHDVRARAFYEALTGRGKKKIQAQCAVMRKYLVGIWACMQTQTTFDSSLLFSEKHLNH
ncbi:IS110 family transposase [Rheinheimera sp. F8]|uniref:IS110 family transposase n=1 Tax=Rheinheimera sp. F8 TaxID=1763998 RepID=UPI000744AC5A|nr:IS110 family transposase [Rheinheimera sp. F8]ALZ75409.1 transposase [Rheinheimera sp. F8]ALZ75411.1 transposase [Rheinheimera sp. F8]ALZ75777.1 transposase [Rheinheimera sp. F8]ALZ77559.1 transposase [Rheinheimera sp. F8]